MNSNAKGKRGEREFRDVLRAAGYCKARRGQQFSGSNESPDVVCPELPGIHWEVKRCEISKPYTWMDQALTDLTKGNDHSIPVVAHKRNGQEWLAILQMVDLLEIIRRSDLPHSANGGQSST